MITQRHQIMRQVVESHRCPPAAAPRIHSELRVAYYHRLVPLIETICSELSTPERINRIDTLEIDLGEVPLDALESAVADRFGTAFRQKLAAAMDGAPDIDADLELFSYFVRTGTVPWWADRADARLLEASLDALIRRTPQALRRAIDAVPDQERAWCRIVRAYPDRLLDDVAAIFAPQLAATCLGPSTSRGTGLGSAWLPMLESASAARGYAARAARGHWWEGVLHAASAGDARVSEARRVFREILMRVARRLGLDYGALVADLHRTLEDSAVPVQPWTRDVSERLWLDLGNDSTRRPASLSERRPAQLQAQVVAALVTARPPARRGEIVSSAATAAPAGVVRTALERGPVAPKLARAARKPAVGAGAKDHSVGSRFSDADEVYVENAGLVILWPFLERCFTRLGLVGEQAFKDTGAVHRAVGLLQHLATGDVLEAEYLLPLNKVLCGMAPEEVFDFGPDLTEIENEECIDLLAAVIQHAPILHDMSIPGFRASFLLRKGQLGSRDGNWLLRVERETHDIVLDRFPWSVHVVILPWMEAMMQVEW